MARNWVAFKSGEVPVVTVRMNDERYRALLDTGAKYSFIAPDLSLLLGLQRERFQAIVGISGQREMLPVVKIPSFGFAQAEMQGCEAIVRNLNPLGLGISLILGVNAFAQRRLQFDFKESRVYLLQ